jgi:hypothetical protein
VTVLRLIAVLLVALPALVVGGCGSDESAEPTITADVEAIRTAAATAMAEIDTARFSVERSGAPIYIDDGDTLAFERAEGRFSAPASADALFTVVAGSLTVEIGAVTIDGATWITNPATGRWEEAPEDLSFDPASLLAPRTGWSPLLADGLSRVELREPAPDDDNRYHLRGVAEGARISVLTGGLVDQSVPIDLWIDAVSGHVVEARFDVETDEGESGWRLKLGDYGAEVEVERPELGAGS